MNVGTKSVLFGVHAFWWHPFTVALAWRRLYRKWPNRYEWCAIFCHDLGYWGCPNMDGEKGRRHPVRGAYIAGKLARFVVWLSRGDRADRRYGHDAKTHWEVEVSRLALFHSREYSKFFRGEPSALCWADKLCVVFDPNWFYLLRARLSGEITEFKANAESQIGKVPDEVWLNWYRNKVRILPEIIQLIAKNDREAYRRLK